MIPASSTGVYKLQNYHVLSWPQAKLIPVPGFYNGAFKGQLKPHHLWCFPDHLLPHRARARWVFKGGRKAFQHSEFSITQVYILISINLENIGCTEPNTLITTKGAFPSSQPDLVRAQSHTHLAWCRLSHGSLRASLPADPVLVLPGDLGFS